MGAPLRVGLPVGRRRRPTVCRVSTVPVAAAYAGIGFCVFPLIWIHIASVTLQSTWEQHQHMPHNLPFPYVRTNSSSQDRLGTHSTPLKIHQSKPAIEVAPTSAPDLVPQSTLPDTLSPGPASPAQTRLAKLSCSAFGGPEQAQEMVYWQDIPSDTTFKSPFREATAQGPGWSRKYVVRRITLLEFNSSSAQLSWILTFLQTFEFDRAGFNNKRMSMETTLALAVAMGRTLVLPPAIRMKRMDNNTGQKSHLHFGDFFPLFELAAEHRFIDIISMQQFLEFEAIQQGSLRHKRFPNKGPFYPPGNRTDWNECSPKEYLALADYLRNTTYSPPWDPSVCIAAFPSSGNVSELVPVIDLLNETYLEGNSDIEFPTPVNSSLHERVHEIIGNRQHLCIYDEVMQREPIVHFRCDYDTGYRLLTHFYTFVFFQDWRLDLWMKRFMRDHGKLIPHRRPFIVTSHVLILLRIDARRTDHWHGPVL
jgi:GDP-fucose protein O-fucosyltransferase